MINQLRLMAIFQSVAELGSFRKAADKLELSPSVVSHHVSQLEEQLGLPLLYRSTRRVSLTDAGEELLQSSQKMTIAAREGLMMMNRRATQPVGRLSVTVPTVNAQSPFVEMFIGFARAYPQVRLSIHVSDEAIGLEGSKFDVALRGRINDLDDSTYKSRKLGSVRYCMFASPEYLQGRIPPKTIDDLAEWDLIQSPQIPWKFLATTEDGETPNREPKVAMSCDNCGMALKFVEAGLGFMIENRILVDRELREGKFVEILPNLKLRPVDFYAVYPANAPRDSLAMLLVDFIRQRDWRSGPDFSRYR